MNKITKIVGVDSKAGRKSRTGSTVTMGVTDLQAIDCQQYFLALEAGEDPIGKIKGIELNLIYEEDLNMQEVEEVIEKTIVDIDDALEVVNGETDID